MLKTGDGLAPAIEIACDGCRSTQDVAPVHLCAGCRSANDARLAAVKLRLSGDVDWADVKKHGLYDRFGVPIATVLSVEMYQGVSIMSTGPTHTIHHDDNSVKIIKCKEMRR